MNEQIRIKPAGLVDARDVLSMQRGLAQYCNFNMDEFGIMLSDVCQDIRSGGVYTVAQHADENVGMMLTDVIRHTWRGVPGIHVEDLYVKPDWRGRGVGKLLLSEACRKALPLTNGQPERASVRLDTARVRNRPTINFYERVGMQANDLNFRIYGQALLALAETS